MLNSARRGFRSRRVVGTVAAAASLIGLSLVGTSAASAADRDSYAGSVPAWATSANDLGATAADTTVEGEIFLPLRNAAAATAFATAVSTPGSSSYKKFLTPDQWISTYSPTQATADKVVNALTSAGAIITAVPDSRQYVVFRATATQINALFGTTLHNYAFGGQSLAAPSSAPSVPSALADSVSAVSIDQGRTLNHPDLVQPDVIPSGSGAAAQSKLVAPSAGPVLDTPCSTYYAQNTVTVPEAYGQTQFSTRLCGYTPRQLRTAYGLDQNKNSGAGQTVAIIDAYSSPSIVSDVNTYSAQLGEATLAQNRYSQIVPNPSEFTDTALCAEPSGWQGEQTLDVESVHGLAPQANILYVGGTNCDAGIDVALSKILDKKLANIVSNSYGNLGEAVPADVVQGQLNLEAQAAGEGIGLYYSSGDSGDEVANLGYASPDFSASSPLVTAVGGTSMALDKNSNILFEDGWGSQLDQIVKTNGTLSYVSPPPGKIFAYGAGGGVSALFAAPAYQKGIVPAALAKNKRVSPDISALADPYTGFLVGIRPIVNDDTLATGTFEKVQYGGTSLASPLAAAQMALIQQGTGTTIGFANPLLYSLAKTNPSLFRDIVPQTPPKALVSSSVSRNGTFLVTLGVDSSLKTTKGYDDVTGIGELKVTDIISSGAVK